MLFFLWGCNSPLNSSSASVSSPPVSLNLVWCLAPNIYICICQLLGEPPKEYPHQVPVSKCLLAIATVLGLLSADKMGFPGGAVPGQSFLQSLLHFLSLFFLWTGTFWG